MAARAVWVLVWVSTFALGCGMQSRAPSLFEIDPPVVCSLASETVLTLSGENFALRVNGAVSESPVVQVPAILLERVGDLRGEDDGLARRVTLDGPSVRWLDAESLQASVSAEQGLLDGTYDVYVINPDTRAVRAQGALVVAGPPVVDSLTPDELCVDAGQVDVRVWAEGLIRSESSEPRVWLNGEEVTVLGASECSAVGESGFVEVCGAVDVQVEASSYPLGSTVSVDIANPGDEACRTAALPRFTVVPPPVLTAVEPASICASATASFIIYGEGIGRAVDVEIGGVPASKVVVIDDDTLEVNLGEGTSPGRYDVTVTSDTGCSATLEDAIELVSNPDIFYVDPPSLLRDYDIWVTAYVADAGSSVIDVELLDDDGSVISSIPYEWSEDRPGVVRALIAAGYTAGTYGLRIVLEDGCASETLDAFYTDGEAVVDVADVTPAAAWTWGVTPIEVRGSEVLPADKVRFEDTPRLYLSAADADTAAGQSIIGVTYRDPDLLTALVPEGLPPGSYHLLVVNPSGDRGILRDALFVLEDPPPKILSISPPSLPNNEAGEIRILGQDFRRVRKVELSCTDDAGNETVDAATVTYQTGTVIDATVSTTSYNRAICQIRVVNEDFSDALYSAISIRNPSENLFGWTAGADLVDARRAAVAVAGRTTSVSRYVYVVGGDAGEGTGANRSVERAPIRSTGEIGEFERLREGFPRKWTRAVGTRIGNFVYVMAGYDTSSEEPSANIYRSEILDPLTVPQVMSVSIFEADSSLGNGLAEGDWSYTISALFPDDDPANPGGETLPGERVSVKISGTAAFVRLEWSRVADAEGYRIYRNAGAGGEPYWILDVDDVTEFVDVGYGRATPSTLPKVDGALGTWARVGQIKTARHSACLAVARDPSIDPERYWVYVAGGVGSSGRALDVIERFPVTIESERVHRLGSVYTQADSLSVARSECVGYGISGDLHSAVEADETYVYFVGGLNGNRLEGAVDVGEVGTNGSFVFFDADDNISPKRAGFGHAAASDFMYALGGQNGSPSKGGHSAELSGATLPYLVNWTALGVSMTEQRYLPASTQESSVILIIGGETATDSASVSTEYTNF